MVIRKTNNVEYNIIPGYIYIDGLDYSRLDEPFTEIKENPGSILINVHLPDISKEDIDVNIRNLSVEVRAANKDNSFYKKINLSNNIIPEKSIVNFKDNILLIRLTKNNL